MKKLLSVLLLIAICLTSLSACGKSDTGSEPDADTSALVGGEVEDGGTESDPASIESTAGDTASGTASTGSTASDSTADSLRGTTVTFASWEDFNGTERANVIQKFTKETGIKVKVVPVTQNDYIVKMASRMNAGKSVDIFIDNQEFPRTLSFAQPITNAGIDVKDPKWNKTIVETSTINGNTYLINAQWDLKYFVLSYNKSLFEGITSPEDYVNQNNWTWDTFAKAAKAISGLGSEYVGAHFSTPIFMAAYGASYVKYDSSKQEFYRATDEAKFAEVWQYILDGQKAGYLNPTYNSAKLVAGTCGMSINDVFALQADGYYTSMKESDWGFTYLPKQNASDPDYPKGALMFAYGLMKGAPNPKAAGVFLNYYLDEKNWNFDNYFANSKAKEFANVLNKRLPESTDYMFICKGPLAITYTYGYSEIDKIFLKLNSSQLNKGVQQSKNKIENAVTKANDMLKAVK
ncbi:MAG: extracellular solute-binding protein [Ruminococcaceae bacterium]|nr:extracellular solute-binding protein [Oscillospiraceae bacterium]